MKLSKHHKLYATARWQKLRARQLAVEPTCRFCRGDGKITIATVVDHVKPHRGNMMLFCDTDNLQSLCKHCHDSRKQRMERSGIVPGADSDGMPIDPNHPWNR